MDRLHRVRVEPFPPSFLLKWHILMSVHSLDLEQGLSDSLAVSDLAANTSRVGCTLSGAREKALIPRSSLRAAFLPLLSLMLQGFPSCCCFTAKMITAELAGG